MKNYIPSRLCCLASRCGVYFRSLLCILCVSVQPCLIATLGTVLVLVSKIAQSCLVLASALFVLGNWKKYRVWKLIFSGCILCRVVTR